MNAGDIAAWVAIAASVALGAWGLRQSSRANAHSDDALRLATSAEARADRLERAATEHRDIQWEQTWHPEALTLSLRNVGTDTAYDVELTVDVDGVPRRNEGPRDIAPQDAIGHMLTSSTREAALAEAGDMWEATLSASVRLTWRSAAEVPDIQLWRDVVLRIDNL